MGYGGGEYRTAETQRLPLPICALKRYSSFVPTKPLIWKWAPENHEHLGQQTATTGSQGPERALVHESVSPAFMGAVNQTSAMVCALGKTEHFLGL